MIEEAKEQNVEVLKQISRSAILESVQAELALKQEIIQDTYNHIDQYISCDDHIFLKYVNSQDEILGFILLRDEWNLSDLFVKPSAHDKGIGRGLFSSAIKEASSRDNRGFIRVNSSLNAVGFYRKLGFEDFEPERPFPDYVAPLIYPLENVI